VSGTDSAKAVDYLALAELRFQVRRFLRFSEAAARKAGLEPQQHQLLLAIKGTDPGTEPTVGALATRLQTRHHSVVELIDRMEARQLVSRRRSELDRRQVRIDLMPEGERILEALSVQHRAELEIAGPALLDALRVLLGR
jgi:DNA-binding MarR family transcriptional regulator